MSEAATLEARALAEDLHTLLVGLDPSRWRADAAEAARAAVADLARRAEALLQAWRDAPPPSDALPGVVAHVAEALRDAASLGDALADWARLRERLVPLYVAVSDAIGAPAVPIDRRPSNPLRSVWHAALGVGVVLAFELAPDPALWRWIAGAWFAFVWSVEVSRRFVPAVQTAIMTAVRSIARAHEYHRVAGSTWYSTALLALALLTPNAAAMLGILALGVGDPVAGEVGRRLGRHRWFGRKSVEGSLAFVGATAAAGTVYLAVFHADVGLAAGAALVAVTALVGAATELVSTRLDDNLTIPLAGAAAAWLVAAALGAPLG